MWYRYCMECWTTFSWLCCIECLNASLDKKSAVKIKNTSYEPPFMVSWQLHAWKKEADNKLSYELDWNFIEAMAKRMKQNKGKYPPYNRQKPMDIESLKQALLRHTIEVMKGNYNDNEELDHNWLWHIMWIACNAMFIYYQLKQWHTTKM